MTANCRGVLAEPAPREPGFADIRREYLAQSTFPTEIVTATNLRDQLRPFCFAREAQAWVAGGLVSCTPPEQA